MTDTRNRYRLVTRSDFDGLVCAVLLKHLDMIDEVAFVHPKDMQDGKVEVTERDITTNLPYVEGAHLVFDHHLSETMRLVGERPNHVIAPHAPSAARVVFDYYGGFESFPLTWDEMMQAVDKSDSAQFEPDDVLHPTGWVLLSFLMDSRTGLGRFNHFRISNYQLMMDLIDYCRFKNIDDIFAMPDVAERISLYNEHATLFKEQLERCATVHENLLVLDLRNEVTIHPGNRFMLYALFPECNISVHVLWGRRHANTVFATGKSIFNRTSDVNIGALMLEYGGGGHENAGTCQVENSEAEPVLEELIPRLTGVPAAAAGRAKGLAHGGNVANRLVS